MLWWSRLIKDLWAGPGWPTCAFWVSSSLYLSCCSNLSFWSISFCKKKKAFIARTRPTLIIYRRLPEAIQTVTPHLTVTPQSVIFLHLPLQLCLRSVKEGHVLLNFCWRAAKITKTLLSSSPELRCRYVLVDEVVLGHAGSEEFLLHLQYRRLLSAQPLLLGILNVGRTEQIVFQLKRGERKKQQSENAGCRLLPWCPVGFSFPAYSATVLSKGTRKQESTLTTFHHPCLFFLYLDGKGHF